VTAQSAPEHQEEVQIMAKPRQATAANSRTRKRRGEARYTPVLHKARAQTAGRKVPVKRVGSQPKRSAAPQDSRPSKQAEVIALLRRPEGATVADIIATTGWQPHTVRGLFSGTLKKKLGLTIASVREERGRTYRIEGGGKQTADRSARGDQ
jgi:hypothetical protein